MRTEKWLHADKLPPELLAWADEAAAIRRDIHSNPELGFDTGRTCALIERTLRGYGIEKIDSESVKGGLIVVLDGDRPGKTIALRADIDALSMPDESGTPWAAKVCRNHACGHDGHAAWLMLTLRYLAAHRDFPGRIVAIFQPAEEIGRGALAVVASGIFEKYGIAEVYGAHNDSMLPAGEFSFRSGPFQASCDFFYIRLIGRGIHAARPHMGIDTMPAAGLLISSLQTIVSRKTDALEPVVLSISSIEAGKYDAPNVIPNELRMSGTVRTYSEACRTEVERQMRLMTEHIAAAQDCTGEVRYDRLTSVVVNDPAAAEAARTLAVKLFGEACVKTTPRTTGGEDFSEYQKKAPGVMFRIGIVDEAHRAASHNPKYDFNDAVLPSAAYFFSELTRARLEALAQAH